MKHLFRFCFSLLLLFTACKNDEDRKAEEQMHDIRMYHQALDMGDYATAIEAAHSLLARDTSQKKYYDTLAMLYFESGRYPQAAQLASMMLLREPNSQRYLEVMARSFQAGGKIDEAVSTFQRLRELTGDPNYDYQLATLNFNANRLDQAQAYVYKIFNTPKIDTSHVKLYTDEGQEQLIPTKAAALNLLGSVKFREKKMDEAADNFKQALAIDSSFMLAKENLNKLNKK